MDTANKLYERHSKDIPFHFVRPRINQVLLESTRCPLVLVCAGTGYGKTSAILDFLDTYDARKAWIQLSELDNVATRFWENFSHAVGHINQPLMHALRELGFPDTPEKMNKYYMTIHEHVEPVRRILVFDDFHHIEDPAVLGFIERSVSVISPLTSFLLVCRSTPQLNITNLASQGLVCNINEKELRFTDQELVQYFKHMELEQRPSDLHDIMADTGGWAFAINLIARSYRQAPGYRGYLRDAMKTNLFKLMETEVFNSYTPELRTFLIKLSLISHLSTDLTEKLAAGDGELIAQMNRQSAYVRRDTSTNTYLIHNLFREYLIMKQSQLSEEQKRETYQLAADWCYHNGFNIDALSYYERIGDYQAVVKLFLELPTQLPMDIAQFAEGFFKRAPDEAFDQVELLAAMHVRVMMSQGKWAESLKLMEGYEARYLKLPQDSAFRNHALGVIYLFWGYLRMLMCTIDDCYDFDQYFIKQDECLSRFPLDPGSLANHPVGMWTSLVGTPRMGALQEFNDALEQAVAHVSHCFSGAMSGVDDLAKGELYFYQGDVHNAELFVTKAIHRAREAEQFETVHHALFFALRCAFVLGDWKKIKQIMQEIGKLLEVSSYPNRYIVNDIIMAWYYCFLGIFEPVAYWLKEEFVPYGHTYFLENFGNCAKAQYCFETRNYAPLLAYISESKQRESILFGRIDLLVLEACMHYRMKDKAGAFATLKEAYETASPNGIVLPFFGRGKDMRTLSSAALKEDDIGIPKDWLEMVNRKSAAFAKCRAHLITQYRAENHLEQDIEFSPRELDILTDLIHGLSRSEIAANQGLSVNTVKMVINNIYTKLGAENLADLIRIAIINHWV